VALVKVLIRHGADMEAISLYGPPLYIAAKLLVIRRYKKIVDMLVHSGVTIDENSAIWIYSARELEIEIKRNPDRFIKSRYSSLFLGDAVIKGSEKTVKLLLDLGFDPNIPKDHPPILKTIKPDKVETRIAELLLSHGANPYVRDPVDVGRTFIERLKEREGTEGLISMIQENYYED
jgi:hypothetical protein